VRKQIASLFLNVLGLDTEGSQIRGP